MQWYKLSLSLALVGLLEYVDGQYDQERDRFYSRVRCHTCEVDFSNKEYRRGHPCLVGDRRDNNRDVALCSRSARYCKAEVARQLGLLVTFQRSCAEECVPSCSTKGFGIVRETCTYCCPNDPSCNEIPEVRRNNYVRPNYTRVGISGRRTQSNRFSAPSSSMKSSSVAISILFALLAAIQLPRIHW